MDALLSNTCEPSKNFLFTFIMTSRSKRSPDNRFRFPPQAMLACENNRSTGADVAGMQRISAVIATFLAFSNDDEIFFFIFSNNEGICYNSK